MMFNHRLTRTATIAVAIAATRHARRIGRAGRQPAPRLPDARGGSAQDRRNPDGRGVNNTVSAVRSGDLRNPDARDYAEGRGTYNAPDVVVAPRPWPRGGGHQRDRAPQAESGYQ
jgi:hypothetical protein